MTSKSVKDKYDVVIVGGGHNGLVAAAYLAKADVDVLVLERLKNTGGAAVSTETFPGLPARLSRYSSLVGLLPQQIIDDLGLDLQLRSRTTASFTPTLRDGKHSGLLVERPEGSDTRESFRALTGSDQEHDAWRAFYGEVSDFAQLVAPTMLEPLRTAREMQGQSTGSIWEQLVEQPIGETIEKRFSDDTVRGLVATDALIGTFADLNDPSLLQNRTFLYHLLGNGTGEWRVPVGGMGAITDALLEAARAAGATVLTGCGVSAVESDGATAATTWHDGTSWHSAASDWVLSNVAPWVLQVLLGEEPGDRPEGSQLKVNLLLERLPTLKSGALPTQAFAGSFHVGESYSQLQAAYADAEAGRVPTTMPGALHCHSLTDPSILGPLAEKGMHSMTYFGLHTPARLFENDLAATRDLAVERALDAINEHIEEPIESLLALDENGQPCLEAKAPQDIDEALAMPGGHIFHGDLSWPWAANRARLDTPAHRWGVATDLDNVLLCGSGARRGGSVSGIGGHNAAQAVLESRSP
ncbi:MAG: phytoene desaturase family protein [Nocardioidaceae bacterium]